MIHYMAPIYASAVKSGKRTLESIQEYDIRNKPLRKGVLAVLIFNAIKSNDITWEQVNADTVNTMIHPYYGITSPDEELKNMIIEYAAKQGMILN